MGIRHDAANINSANETLAENECDVEREMRIDVSFLAGRCFRLVPSVVLTYEVINMRY